MPNPMVLFTLYRRLLFGAMILVASASALAEDAPVDPVVAKVGETAITRSDFDRALKAIARGGDVSQVPAEVRQRLLDQMIDTQVLFQLARKADIAVTDEEVAEVIDRTRGRMASDESFDELLDAQGIDRERFEQAIRDQIRSRKFVDSKTAGIVVTEEEVSAEYDKLKEAGKLDIVDFAHILIRVKDDADSADAEARAKAARKRILDGESFAKVAGEVSDDTNSAERGGMYVGIRRGQFPPALDVVLFAAPLDEALEPFRTEAGWHIVRVSGRSQMSFEDVKPMLKRGVETAKRAAAVADLIKDARATMTIEILEPVAPPVVDPATPAAPSDTSGSI